MEVADPIADIPIVIVQDDSFIEIAAQDLVKQNDVLLDNDVHRNSTELLQSKNKKIVSKILQGNKCCIIIKYISLNDVNNYKINY